MMTLIILTWCGFFSVPLVYKNNQVKNLLWRQAQKHKIAFKKINIYWYLLCARLLLMMCLVRSTPRCQTSRRRWWGWSPARARTRWRKRNKNTFSDFNNFKICLHICNTLSLCSLSFVSLSIVFYSGESQETHADMVNDDPSHFFTKLLTFQF